MFSLVRKSQFILAIESSCDETAICIAEVKGKNFQEKEFKIREHCIYSQSAIHSNYGGVVPELAAREHSSRIKNLVNLCCEKSSVSLKEIDLFSATQGPGLSSSLLIGHTFAKGLACFLNKPFFSVNHLHGHLLSPFIDKGKYQPHLSLIVSGGHTLLVDSRKWNENEIIGSTLDDAAGEAIDKAGRMLNLSYPAGPEIERKARKGDRNAFSFPCALPQSLDFSFSGIKTSLLYTLKKLEKPLGEEILSDICASFQNSIIASLRKKLISAAKEYNARLVTLSGGVARNKQLQASIEEGCKDLEIQFLSASPEFCTDNAGMIAYVAFLKFLEEKESSLEEDIFPSLESTQF